MTNITRSAQTDLEEHETDETNPHNVDETQTGAADSLSNHTNDTTNPHNVTDAQTGAAAALSDHEALAEPHHARYTDSEAAAAAPVQDVNGKTGSVTVDVPNETAEEEIRGGLSDWNTRASYTLSAGATRTDSFTVSGDHTVIDEVEVSASDNRNDCIIASLYVERDDGTVVYNDSPNSQSKAVLSEPTNGYYVEVTVENTNPDFSRDVNLNSRHREQYLPNHSHTL